MGGDLAETIPVEVAEAADVSRGELPPLYESIEVECLEGLFAHANNRPGAEITVQFIYAGYTVTVSGPQRVSVEE